MTTKFTRKLIIVLMLITFPNYAQYMISTDDLKPILGEWTGSLTYIDYSSNKSYTMPSNLMVKPGKNENQLLLSYSYPKEPKANSKGKIKISDDGKLLNKKAVVLREDLTDGSVRITIEYMSKDNNKEALIKGVYVFGKSVCVIRKEVKYKASDQWLKRNEYLFTREAEE